MILDVRSAREYAAGHVPGAIHAPYWRLLLGRPALPRGSDEPLVVYCGHGPRAWIAKAVLAARGVRAALLPGHMRAWKRAGKPLESGDSRC